MNNPKAKKAMQTISVCGKKTGLAVKKTGLAAKKTGKWISKVSQTMFHLSKHLCTLKSQELKMKKACMKLGELAYNRWKRKKAMSLQEHLNMIKELDIDIQSNRKALLYSQKKLNSLFRFKAKYSEIRPQRKPEPEQKNEQKNEKIQPEKQSQTEKTPAGNGIKTSSEPKKAVKKSTAKKTQAKPKKSTSSKTKKKVYPKTTDKNTKTT